MSQQLTFNTLTNISFCIAGITGIAGILHCYFNKHVDNQFVNIEIKLKNITDSQKDQVKAIKDLHENICKNTNDLTCIENKISRLEEDKTLNYLTTSNAQIRDNIGLD